MKNKPTIQKNDEIELKITAYTSEGYGIGRVDGFAVFVPYALKGEMVKAHIIKVNKNFALGKLLEVTSESTQTRCTPECSQYDKCGGCDMQHMNYDMQLEFKRERVVGALGHLAGIENADSIVLPIKGAESPLRYRNKASFPFAEIDGKVCAGFFAPRSHRLVPIDDCPIQLSNTVKAMRTVVDWANKYKISAFNEQTGNGILRHLVVRSCMDKLLITLVTAGSTLPFAKELYELLTDKISGISGLVQNINDRATNVILGNRFKTLYGSPELTDEICGLKFNVQTPSFLQVNHTQTEKLYNTALEFLNLNGTEQVCDVYCGIGTISLMLAQHAAHVIGIESVEAAVDDARNNAIQNSISNTDFIADVAEKALPNLVAQGNKIDAIVIDPPRKGCEPHVIDAIIESGTEKVIYVSCNPETLARDVKLLKAGGYEVKKAQPVDMFPQTSHVECVVLMSKKA